MKRSTEEKRHILAADIGGTHSRFAHFAADPEGGLEMMALHWLNTAAADSFATLLKNLRDSAFPYDPGQADIVVIAVAGPVTGGVVGDPPSIPWRVDISAAGRDYGFRRTLLINDFVAQAFACLSPIGRFARMILAGVPEPSAPIAVIGAGTGLGKAVLVPDEGRGYCVLPSEGAHAAFPFVGDREAAFQRFLARQNRTRYATYNQVVSGSGLTALHAFLAGPRLEPAAVAERFPDHPETLEWFARFYGRACRDFALETVARGGLYISGGIAARNPAILLQDSFRTEFLDSAAMGRLLAGLPVYCMQDENSGLWGAAMKAVGAWATESQ